MLFSSPIFLFLFLPLSLLFYLILPKSLKNIVLLTLSLLFYSWGEGLYVFLILGLALINYFFGLVFSFKINPRIVLTIAILTNLGVLFYFKYLVFFITVFLKFIYLPVSKPVDIHLPLGISFVTFHFISYIADVFRGKLSPEKNPLNFVLYIFLFPHLIAGPIVRYADIRKQITSRVVRLDDFSYGIDRFIVGLGKKVIIANSLAVVVEKIFSLFPHQLSPAVLWLGVIGFTLQIYFDFSGYSDMAIGLARMFGFKFKENFNYPYISTSVQEFWRRWHMTLSNWFKDYLYIPLGGNRKGGLRTALNLLVVFSLTGLWHGASLNFLFWGFYYGVFLVFERIILRNIFKLIWWPYRYIYTIIVVMVGWVFFKVESLSYALFLVKMLFGFVPDYPSSYPIQALLDLETTIIFIAAILIAVPVFPNIHKWIQNKRLALFKISYPIGSLIFLAATLIYSSMQLASNSYNPFIYFRF